MCKRKIIRMAFNFPGAELEGKRLDELIGGPGIGGPDPPREKGPGPQRKSAGWWSTQAAEGGREGGWAASFAQSLPGSPATRTPGRGPRKDGETSRNRLRPRWMAERPD